MNEDRLQANCLECGELNEVGLNMENGLITAIMKQCGHTKDVCRWKLQNTKDGKVEFVFETIIE